MVIRLEVWISGMHQVGMIRRPRPRLPRPNRCPIPSIAIVTQRLRGHSNVRPEPHRIRRHAAM